MRAALMLASVCVAAAGAGGGLPTGVAGLWRYSTGAYEIAEDSGGRMTYRDLSFGAHTGALLSTASAGAVAPPPGFTATWFARLGDGHMIWFRLDDADTLSTLYKHNGATQGFTAQAKREVRPGESPSGAGGGH
eukprot:gene8283-20550_t